MADGMMKKMAGMMSGDMMKKMDAMTQDMKSELMELKGSEFDEKFIEMMIMHHQQAMEVAMLAQTNAGSEELKSMVNDMLEKMQAELRMMQAMQKQMGFSSEDKTE